jgi:hypothetical protein
VSRADEGSRTLAPAEAEHAAITTSAIIDAKSFLLRTTDDCRDVGEKVVWGIS